MYRNTCIVSLLISLTLPRAGAAATYENHTWPSGIVPYTFGGTPDPVAEEDKPLLYEAMLEWENVADVTFVPWTTENSFLIIGRAGENDSSFVGMQGGPQSFVVGMDQWSKRTLVRKLGLVLGLHREHQRGDRDVYVQPQLLSISPGARYRFDLLTGVATYGPYDFNSIMHFSQCEHSISESACGLFGVFQSLVVVTPYENQQEVMGTHDTPSPLDAAIMTRLYRHDDDRFLDASHTGPLFLGTPLLPYSNLSQARSQTPNDGTVWIQPGDYTATSELTRRLTYKAPLGGVTIDN